MSTMLNFPAWKVRGFPVTGGTSMSNEFVRRGGQGVYYANVTYRGIRLRDCLKTVDRNEAQRRIIELKLLVGRGDYQKAKQTFDDLAEKYKPSSERKAIIMKVHLMPEFSGKKLSEIDVDTWAFDQAERHPESTCKKHFQVMKELGFKLPKVKFKQGKQFNREQILSEADVLKVINQYVNVRYRIACLISAFSGLRLKNVVHLKRKEVNLKSGWLNIEHQSKTGKPVSIPISPALKNVFGLIKVWPMKDKDRFFPDLNEKPISVQVGRAFNRAGIPWGSFHHFRHFAACHLINNHVPLEVVREFLGHADIKSTLVYARLKGETLQEAVRVLDTTLTQVGGH
ncbi:MAG TPA: site-specific integrase [Nitrospinaceae bacterium]|nr:site-specific integrase [Nitrospinaceae bacterium]